MFISKNKNNIDPLTILVLSELELRKSNRVGLLSNFKEWASKPSNYENLDINELIDEIIENFSLGVKFKDKIVYEIHTKSRSEIIGGLCMTEEVLSNIAKQIKIVFKKQPDDISVNAIAKRFREKFVAFSANKLTDYDNPTGFVINTYTKFFQVNVENRDFIVEQVVNATRMSNVRNDDGEKIDFSSTFEQFALSYDDEKIDLNKLAKFEDKVNIVSKILQFDSKGEMYYDTFSYYKADILQRRVMEWNLNAPKGLSFKFRDDNLPVFSSKSEGETRFKYRVDIMDYLSRPISDLKEVLNYCYNNFSGDPCLPKRFIFVRKQGVTELDFEDDMLKIIKGLNDTRDLVRFLDSNNIDPLSVSSKRFRKGKIQAKNGTTVISDLKKNLIKINKISDKLDKGFSSNELFGVTKSSSAIEERIKSIQNTCLNKIEDFDLRLDRIYSRIFGCYHLDRKTSNVIMETLLVKKKVYLDKDEYEEEHKIFELIDKKRKDLSDKKDFIKIIQMEEEIEDEEDDEDDDYDYDEDDEDYLVTVYDLYYCYFSWKDIYQVSLKDNYFFDYSVTNTEKFNNFKELHRLKEDIESGYRQYVKLCRDFGLNPDEKASLNYLITNINFYKIILNEVLDFTYTITDTDFPVKDFDGKDRAIWANTKISQIDILEKYKRIEFILKADKNKLQHYDGINTLNIAFSHTQRNNAIKAIERCLVDINRFLRNNGVLDTIDEIMKILQLKDKLHLLDRDRGLFGMYTENIKRYSKILSLQFADESKSKREKIGNNSSIKIKDGFIVTEGIPNTRVENDIVYYEHESGYWIYMKSGIIKNDEVLFGHKTFY